MDLATARGGAGQWGSPANGVVRARLCYGPRHLTQKEAGGNGVLTEGLGRLICAAQGTGGEVRAALGRSSAAWSKQGASGRLGCGIRRATLLERVTRG